NRLLGRDDFRGGFDDRSFLGDSRLIGNHRSLFRHDGLLSGDLGLGLDHVLNRRLNRGGRLFRRDLVDDRLLRHNRSVLGRDLGGLLDNRLLGHGGFFNRRLFDGRFFRHDGLLGDDRGLFRHDRFFNNWFFDDRLFRNNGFFNRRLLDHGFLNDRLFDNRFFRHLLGVEHDEVPVDVAALAIEVHADEALLAVPDALLGYIERAADRNAAQDFAVDGR